MSLSEKKVAIVQSNYVPWKGYFDMIALVDEFILYDDVQYTKRDWRNRNLIKTSTGLKWITIPVEVKGRYHQQINETKIADEKWAELHWDILRFHYKNAKFFKLYEEIFAELYLGLSERYLSKINYTFISKINELLGIKTTIRWSSEFELVEGKTERLLNICKEVSATHYISGPAAKSYLNESLFLDENIEVVWMDYLDYPEYNQIYPPFEHGVSILDLIFNLGPDAHLYMKNLRQVVER